MREKGRRTNYHRSKVMHTPLFVTRFAHRRFVEQGKRVTIRHLSSECGQLMKEFNGETFPYGVVETGPDDPSYRVAAN